MRRTVSPGVALWALVDCNSFFCSCERLFRPELEGRPVVVLSNNDGCLIALTPEAKALGYRMGDVFFQVEHRLRRHGVAVFSSNYTLYGDISRRVMGTMATLAPVEQYSIDEAFIPMDAVLAAQAEDVGWAIHDRVKTWVGVPVRCGIGTTRTLAKLANHWAKKIRRVLRLDAGSPLTEELLEKTPVGDIWGIGRRQSKKLVLNGVRNARQLRDMDLDRALRLLTVVGQRIVHELRGHPCIIPETAPVPRRTLISSRSFGRRTAKRDDLAEALALHAAIAGERLRGESMVASSIAVWCETSRHMEDPYHSIRGTGHFPMPTNITGDIITAAHAALDACYEKGHEFMKGGIMLYDLEEENGRQATLMEAALTAGQERRRALMRTVDRINDRYGRDTLRSAAQGMPEAGWGMRRERMSPLYTTSIEDWPRVRTG